MVIFWFFFFARAWPPPTPDGHRRSTGALLEAMRSEAGFSLQQLAEVMSRGGYRTSKAALYKYEQGERPVPLESFDAVAAACGFDLEPVHALRTGGVTRLRDVSGVAREARQEDSARPDDLNRAELLRHFQERLRAQVDSPREAEPTLPAPASRGETRLLPGTESALESKEQEILEQLRHSSIPTGRAIRLFPPMDPGHTLSRLARHAGPDRPVTLVASSRQAADWWKEHLRSVEDVRVSASRDLVKRSGSGSDLLGARGLLLFDGIDAIRMLDKAVARGQFPNTDLVVVASALDGVSERTLVAGQIEIEEVGCVRDGFRGQALAGFAAHLLIADDPSPPRGRGRRVEAPPWGMIEAIVAHLELWDSRGRLVILAGADDAAEAAAELLRWRSRDVSLVGRRTRASPSERAFSSFASAANGVLCLGRRVRRLDPMPPVSRVCILAPIHSARLEEHVLPFLAASAGGEPVRFDELVLGEPSRRIRTWQRLIQEGTSEVGAPGTLRFSPFPPR